MEQINREHPEYAANQAMWRRYADLYTGGEQFRRNATEYLTRRSKEPQEVYGERVSRAFYENYIGSIIDWYAATLMRREPTLICEGPNESGRQFFNAFTEDCDRRGTNLSEFFRRQLVDVLIYGRSYTAVEFPRFAEPVTSRAEEDAAGRSRAYLVSYTPRDLINWSRDDDGNFEWVVLRSRELRADATSSSGWRQETRWVRYDRENFHIYRAHEGGEIELTDNGRHGLAALGRVPLFATEVTDGLWLMNKGAQLQLEHFNKSNALSWALTMGLFAMPVVYSEREWNQIAGESYYIQLGPDDRFGWTEPEGHVFQIAQDNLVRLKDEIYRVCYLMTQAGGTSTANVSQSGLSKQRDHSVTQEVLRAYGDAVRETMKQTLRAIASARRDGLRVDVTGVDDFDIADFGGELDDAKKLLDLGIESPTLKRQLFKKLAFKYFADAEQSTKDAIAREIDG